MEWKNIFPEKYKYYETNNGIIYHCDFRDIIPLFPPESVDLIITSPPYNIGIDYSDWNDRLSYEDFLFFLEDFVDFSVKILCNKGILCVNIFKDVKMRNRKGKIINVCEVCELYRLFKSKDVKYLKTFDLYKTGQGFFSKEKIITGYKKEGGKDIPFDKTLEKEFNEGMLKISPVGKWITKANFPLDIPEKMIRIFSENKYDIIIDPFLGAGTTALAAEKAERKWIGIEISEIYIKETIKRFKKEIK